MVADGCIVVSWLCKYDRRCFGRRLQISPGRSQFGMFRLWNVFELTVYWVKVVDIFSVVDASLRCWSILWQGLCLDVQWSYPKTTRQSTLLIRFHPFRFHVRICKITTNIHRYLIRMRNIYILVTLIQISWLFCAASKHDSFIQMLSTCIYISWEKYHINSPIFLHKFWYKISIARINGSVENEKTQISSGDNYSRNIAIFRPQSLTQRPPCFSTVAVIGRVTSQREPSFMKPHHIHRSHAEGVAVP